MSTIHYFSNQPRASDIPDRCRDPFDNDPHPLALIASKKLQQRLIDTPLLSAPLFEKNNGKMFGVLVVVDEAGRVGYLSSFSGMLNRQWIVPGFVPPVFNIKQQQAFLEDGEKQVSKLTRDIEMQLNASDYLQNKIKLTCLEQQKENELALLKKQHKNNKAQRKTKREVIKSDQNKAQILQQLSYLSQQDKRDLKQLKSDWNEKILAAQKDFKNGYENKINKLIVERKSLSQQLHKKVFESYQLINKSKESKPLMHFFDGKIPPGGTGDCAA
ncbi:MAG: hypothetical protein KAU21_19740, partial [Gammaproteobacteria bacterium]|nr:hypothetical protein [Gammaproteobacteria bacterium]